MKGRGLGFGVLGFKGGASWEQGQEGGDGVVGVGRKKPYYF